MRQKIALSGAGRQDIPFIVDLLERNGLPASDVPEKLGSLFLARSGREVVGVGGVELLGEYGLLRSLAVREEERNKGYGGAVTRALVDHARREGVRDLYLLTMTAAPFFERLGFRRVGRDQAPEPVSQTGEFAHL